MKELHAKKMRDYANALKAELRQKGEVRKH
jgi:hypothetical protein